MYMTTGEAAHMLGVGLNTIKRWINNGEMRGVCTPGGHWRIPKDELHKFMEKHGMLIPDSDQSTPARVLIVDDDPATCMLLGAMLEQIEVPPDVQCAHDGYTGLMRIGAWQPDVLVLDILMPGINGLEVLRRIRTSPELDDMSIIVITSSFDQPGVMQAVRSAKVAAMLPKPVDTRRFLETIGACLAARAASRDKQLM